MKLKKILKEHKKLNQAIKYIEWSKDQLYSYIQEDHDGKEMIKSWFPIEEGKELADSDVLKLIKYLDQIVLAIVDGEKKSVQRMKLKEVTKPDQNDLLGLAISKLESVKGILHRYIQNQKDPEKEVEDFLKEEGLMDDQVYQILSTIDDLILGLVKFDGTQETFTDDEVDKTTVYKVK
ncbi:MAG: hypothetical protein ACKVJG_18395 [Candidatus Latescibacterota bacterium]|jgi:hypothetical protein